MRVPSLRSQRGRPLRWYVALSVAVLTAAGTVRASLPSDIPDTEHRLIGHPRERFPLTIYAESASSSPLDSAIQDAVAQWNQVFEHEFHEAAFTWTDNKTGADILIRFAKTSRVHGEMGDTEIDADKRGIIRLPVRINLNPPKSRGRTDVRQMLFDVAAHELGHALGLPHINQASSIMCCDPGAINFSDPTSRATYIQSRRHPDLGSVAPDLAAHYHKFWKENGSARRPN